MHHPENGTFRSSAESQITRCALGTLTTITRAASCDKDCLRQLTVFMKRIEETAKREGCEI